MAPSNELYGDPLDDVPADSAIPPIVESSGARVGMTGQMLHIFKRD